MRFMVLILIGLKELGMYFNVPILLALESFQLKLSWES